MVKSVARPDVHVKEAIRNLTKQPQLEGICAFFGNHEYTKLLGPLDWLSLARCLDQQEFQAAPVAAKLLEAYSTYARHDAKVQQRNLSILLQFADSEELEQKLTSAILDATPEVLFESQQDDSNLPMVFTFLTSHKTWLVVDLRVFCERQDTDFRARLCGFQFYKGLLQKTLSRTEPCQIDYLDSLINFLKAFNIRVDDDADPLHTAIDAGRLDVVTSLLGSYPKMLQLSGGSRNLTAMQTLREREIRDDRDDEDMASFLEGRIFRLRDPHLIRRLFYSSEYEGMVDSLDLSCFENANFNFDKFLQRLELAEDQRRERGLHTDPFEMITLAPILLLVKLPELPHGSLAEKTQILSRIFKYLENRGVNIIQELVISNTRGELYREDDIAAMLDSFAKIAILKWIRQDVSLEILKPDNPMLEYERLPPSPPVSSEAPTPTIPRPLKSIKAVESIYLYASNWGMVSYWLGDEGLRTYEEITFVYLILIKNLICADQTTAHRVSNYKQRAETKLETMKRDRLRRNIEFGYEVTIQTWDQTDPVAGERSTLAVQGYDAPKLLGLAPGFLEAYRPPAFGFNYRLPRDPDRPSFATRVAILDTGVDITNDLLRNQIDAAASFIAPAGSDSESPCWLPSSHHGHQMAYLVRSIDPHCRLYIAKVGIDQNQNINPSNVLRAVQWAIDQDVDIISISMTFTERNSQLGELLKAASLAGITIFCSTDQGESAGNVYPAAWAADGSVMSISACNSRFQHDFYTVATAKYLVPAENILVESVSYLKPHNPYESGSSVATALAAGIGSLVLSCLNWARVNAPQEVLQGRDRLVKINHVFNQMLPRNDNFEIINRSLHPAKVFDSDKARRLRVARPGTTARFAEEMRVTQVDWDHYIRTCFRLGGEVHGP